jgi:hypothetical protein
MKDHYFHLLLFFKLQWIGKLVIIVKLIQYWLIDWLTFCSLTFSWQIFNTYSGRERNSLIYTYYIEIQTLLFSPDRSLSRECQYLPSLKVLGKDCRLRTGNRHMSSLYQYIVGLHDKIYLYKDVLISSNFSYYYGGYAQIYLYL